MAKKSLPCPTVLRQLLRYEPDTGKLFWKRRERYFFTSHKAFMSWNGKNALKEAFTAQNGAGYFVGSLAGMTPRAHRVAWAIFYGEWPQGEIDHVNCDGYDNRISNLRIATSSENKQNQRLKVTNTSGFKGVNWAKRERLWRAYASINGKQHCFGYFSEIDMAVKAHAIGVAKLHGEFSRIR